MRTKGSNAVPGTLIYLKEKQPTATHATTNRG